MSTVDIIQRAMDIVSDIDGTETGRGSSSFALSSALRVETSSSSSAEAAESAAAASRLTSVVTSRQRHQRRNHSNSRTSSAVRSSSPPAYLLNHGISSDSMDTELDMDDTARYQHHHGLHHPVANHEDDLNNHQDSISSLESALDDSMGGDDDDGDGVAEQEGDGDYNGDDTMMRDGFGPSHNNTRTQ